MVKGKYHKEILTHRKKWLFHCPGCLRTHYIDIDRWSFNGDFDKPTFSPSFRVVLDRNHTQCHFFIKEGRIEFLSDCKHGLAGQTVELPVFE